MSRPAILVESVSKRYRIGVAEEQSDTLFQAGLSWLRAPLTNFRRLRSLSNFGANGSADVIWPLEDVSFEVAEGEVVGLIGRNGAGKSTLLKVLSRITPPTKGRVVLNGRVASLLEVGTGFHPELTGRENVYLNGTVLGMRKVEIDRRFDEIVDFSGVEKFIDTPIKRYSSGMQVRLAFSVAAYLEPEILLIDEVLAVGDAEFQKRCLGKMSEVAQAGRTVLFVSHNMGAVSNLCPRSILLSEGRIYRQGATDQVVSAYLHDTLGATNEHSELTRLRRPGVGEQTHFTEINLESSDRGFLCFGEPIDIQMTAYSKQKVEGLNVGVSLFNVMGDCVGTYFTRETFDLQADESRRMCLHIPNVNLAPGQYYTTLSLGKGGHTSSRQDLDLVSGIPVFQVAPVAGDQSEHIVKWYRSWGSIVLADARLILQ